MHLFIWLGNFKNKMTNKTQTLMLGDIDIGSYFS